MSKSSINVRTQYIRFNAILIIFNSPFTLHRVTKNVFFIRVFINRNVHDIIKYSQHISVFTILPAGVFLYMIEKFSLYLNIVRLKSYQLDTK